MNCPRSLRLKLRLRALTLASAFALSFAGFVAARLPAAENKIDFARDIRPILASRCYDCHGAQKPKGGLQLTSLSHALRGGESGEPALVAGQSARSVLLQRILADDEDDVMPQKGERLAPAEIALLKAWIDQGATWPDGLTHWAYVKPVRPPVPAVADRDAVVHNAIDAFILARLAPEGLRQSPSADKPRWLRRVSLDLIGLPPTPADLAAFLADESAGAHERVVDRLLASPQYGERWARPWLDLARYADSHGFQRDDLRDSWAYRDWVIRAMNADLPFDQFTLWQIAGDLLPETQNQKLAPPNLDALIATGFHRAAPTNIEAGADQEETRVNQVIDRVNTTAAVWLGSTLECAQCHDHKYDPFSQKDYYQLFAFFNNTVRETDFISPKATATLKFTGPYLSLSGAKTATKLADVEARLEALDEEIEELTELPPTGGGAAAETARATLKERKRERAKLARNAASLTGPQTLVMQELEKPRSSAVLNRGNFLDPGEPVQPGTPAVLHPLRSAPAAPSPGSPSRLDLARWLVDPANPLVARVTVNRWWAEFFGRGLVSTLEDFGVKGEAPTHPELLDWLAVEFMAGGWSMKRLHKVIVLSATYRQSSRVTPELLARDDQNKLLARGPRFRLDAEAIRDNALAAAGLLSLKQGGPPVRPYQPPGLWEKKVGGTRVTYDLSTGEDAWRRGIYTVWKRTSPYPSFVNFDATSRTACTVRRSRSNTPLQALTLLNDPVYVEAATALAKRVLAERPAATTAERIRYAFELCLTRAPAAHELAALEQLHAHQHAAHAKETVAWHAVATALLNLDEMITKG